MRLCWSNIEKLDIYLTSYGNLYSRTRNKTLYEKECPICKEQFLAIRRYEHLNSTGYGRECCSQTCAAIHAKSFSSIDRNGYRRVFNHDKRMWRLEHVIKAEKILNRPLNKHECVHHIDGDQSNNENKNLLICTRSYHGWLHWEMSRRYAKEKFGGTNYV